MRGGSPPQALRRLVQEAAEEPSLTAVAALADALVETVDGVVIALITERAGFPAAAALGGAWRTELVETTLTQLLAPTSLQDLLAVPESGLAHALEVRAQKAAGQATDQAWIAAAIDRRDPEAERSLFARLPRLFLWAARRRGLDGSDREDASQEFNLWLVKDDYAALRRWDPRGGRSFDGWFTARALNQIDSWRRRHRQPTQRTSTITEVEEIAPSLESRLRTRSCLLEIQGWLADHASAEQRELFERWFLRGESAAEIAQSMGKRTPTVHVAISRLRRALKAAYGD